MRKTLKNAEYLDPYIIAEIGVNHGGNMDLAKKIIQQAAAAGADAAKFQTYKADKLASKGHSPYYWDINEEPAENQHSLFSMYDKFGETEYKELKKCCDENNIDFLSTPFDLESADMIDPLVPFHKIASADITNIPLLRKIASKKKTILLSTGASTNEEITNAINTLYNPNVSEIYLLHCVLNYPTPKEHAQLALLTNLKEDFKNVSGFGYSDHVAPNTDGTMPALEMAVIQGAVVIEKHFTHDKNLKGNDHYHAMDEKDLKAFRIKLSDYKKIYGSGKRNLEWEKKAVTNARRRIVASKDIKTGDEINEGNIIALRANTGIEVSFWDNIIGKKAAADIPSGKPLENNDIIK